MDDVGTILLQRIPQAPSAISTPELVAVLANEGFELTPRAVQKRLAGLAEQHRLRCDDSGKPFRWSWEPGHKQRLFPRMAPHEALGLVLAAEHMRPLLPPRTVQWLDDRLAQTEKELAEESTGRPKRWRTKVRRVPPELPRIPPKVDDKIFRTVSEALYEGLVLSISYRKRFTTEDHDYVVHPLGLCERAGELWLVARKEEPDGTPGDVRFFLLHRMHSAKLERGRTVKTPVGFSLDRTIEEGLAHFPLELGSHVRLKARFHRDVIEKLAEAKLSEDQVVKRVDGDWYSLEATVPHTRALHAFLVGYGPHCVVEAPKALRAHVLDDLRRAVSLYER